LDIEAAMKRIAFLCLISLLATPVFAAEKTATFSVPGMTCALCPVTISIAMSNVEGVISATADFDTKTATAVFDDTNTSEAALAEASANAGYPATLVSVQ
jgi:periplasmic mercuric ion binding protein